MLVLSLRSFLIYFPLQSFQGLAFIVPFFFFFLNFPGPVAKAASLPKVTHKQKLHLGSFGFICTGLEVKFFIKSRSHLRGMPEGVNCWEVHIWNLRCARCRRLQPRRPTHQPDPRVCFQLFVERLCWCRCEVATQAHTRVNSSYMWSSESDSLTLCWLLAKTDHHHHHHTCAKSHFKSNSVQ